MHTPTGLSLFVIMLSTGDYEDKKTKPIGVCTDKDQADRFVESHNAAARRPDGKIEARNIMLRDWFTTHRVDEFASSAEEGRAERDRVTNLLGIPGALKRLGFEREYGTEHATWYVVEAPMNPPTHPE